MINKLNILFCLALTVFFSSCVSHKELVNFNNEESPLTIGTEDIVNAMNLKIQAEDLLRIQVHSADKDQLAAMPFNIELPMQQQGMIQQANQAGSGGNYPIELFNGYLVDQEGNIDFPVIGKLKLMD
jgi:polysaccharide export outer membrane protein